MSDLGSWLPRMLPLLFALLLIGGLVGYRAMRFRRLYGRSPIHKPQPGDRSAHAFISRVVLIYFGVVGAIALLVAVYPGGLEAVDLLYARRVDLLVPGLVFSSLSALIVWRAQEDMAASWRIGIDEAEKTDLVTGGLYRFCRNPIYLGLQLALIGFVCLVPGYLTLALLAVALVLFQVQARLEEAYLLATHGEPYARYCRQVGRFLPWTGRWPAAFAVLWLLMPGMPARAYDPFLHERFPVDAFTDRAEAMKQVLEVATRADVDAFRVSFYEAATHRLPADLRARFVARYPTVAAFDAYAFKEFLGLNPAKDVWGFDRVPSGPTSTVLSTLQDGSRFPESDLRAADRYYRDAARKPVLGPDGEPIPFDPMTLKMGGLSGLGSMGHAHYELPKGPLSEDPEVLKRDPRHFAVPPDVQTWGADFVQTYIDLAMLAQASGTRGGPWLARLFEGTAFLHLTDVCNQVHTVQVGIYEFFYDATLESYKSSATTLFGLLGKRESFRTIGVQILKNHHTLSEALFAKRMKALLAGAPLGTDLASTGLRGALTALAPSRHGLEEHLLRAAMGPIPTATGPVPAAAGAASPTSAAVPPTSGHAPAAFAAVPPTSGHAPATVSPLTAASHIVPAATGAVSVAVGSAPPSSAPVRAASGSTPTAATSGPPLRSIPFAMKLAEEIVELSSPEGPEVYRLIRTVALPGLSGRTMTFDKDKDDPDRFLRDVSDPGMARALREFYVLQVRALVRVGAAIRVLDDLKTRAADPAGGLEPGDPIVLGRLVRTQLDYLDAAEARRKAYLAEKGMAPAR